MGTLGRGGTPGAPVPLRAGGGSGTPRVPPALVGTVVAAAPAGTLGRLPAATMARPSPTRSRAACGTCGPCPPGPPCPPFGSTPERGTTRPSALGASSAANVPGRPGGTPSAGARARPVPFRAATITTGDSGAEADRRLYRTPLSAPPVAPSAPAPRRSPP